MIVDEIHAVLGDKRGSHLALSLERLRRWWSAPARAAAHRLSATQKPLRPSADFLGGAGAR